MLVLLQNFFYFGSIENFSIFCGFIRAMSVKSVKQLFMLCKILAPFIYRLTTKPETFGEVQQLPLGLIVNTLSLPLDCSRTVTVLRKYFPDILGVRTWCSHHPWACHSLLGYYRWFLVRSFIQLANYNLIIFITQQTKTGSTVWPSLNQTPTQKPIL